jgi:hypothetical protein
MLLERSQTALHRSIAESEDLNCLRGLRQKLSWLQQGHKVAQAFQDLRERIRIRLQDPMELVIMTDIDTCLAEEIPVEEITDAYKDQPLKPLAPEGEVQLPVQQIKTDWLVAYAVFQSLSEAKAVPIEMKEIVTLFFERIDRKIKALEQPELVPKTETRRIKRKMTGLTDDLRAGQVMNPKQISKTITDALFKENPAILEEALRIALLWKKAENRGQPIINARTRKAVDSPISETDVTLLASKLMTKKPSCDQQALAISTLARYDVNPLLCIRIAESLYENRESASGDDLATALWSLGQMEAGEEISAKLCEELCERISSPALNKAPLSRISTVSALKSMGVLDLDPDQAAVLLKHARSFSDLDPSFRLRKNDVTRCFQAAVYFDYDVEYWHKRYQALSSSEPASKKGPTNRSERKLGSLLRWYVGEASIPVRIERNIKRYGLECDWVLTFKNGQVLIFELDGPHHKKQLKYDRYRDAVMEKRGDIVVRLTVDELRALSSSENRSLSYQKGGKLGLISRAHQNELASI